VFEFDPAGDGVTAGRQQVDISGDTTEIQVAATLAAAIETAYAAGDIYMRATDNGDGTIALENSLPGAQGNQTITENVAPGAFLVGSLTGGVNAAAPQIHLKTKTGFVVTGPTVSTDWIDVVVIGKLLGSL